MKGLTANTKYCYMVGGTLVDENTLVKFLRDSSPFALTMKPGNAWVHIGSMVCLGPEMRVILDNRRKFRSQTSDNMDRWKAEMGRVREKRTVEERRIEERKKSEKRKSQKKEDAGARKGRKVAKHCVFPMICGSGGSKSRLAKAAEMKNCTPLLREAHFEVKMYKTHQVPTTFGSCDVEKAHAVVARSTCPSQNAQNTPGPDHFWKLRCRKSARRCGAKHISKSKCTKHDMFAPLLEVQMCFRVARARDCGPCQKWAKREGFVAFPKTLEGVGHLKRICKDAFSVAGAVQETSSSELLGGPGGDFLRGVAFWSIRSSGLLRLFQVQHFVWPGITFPGRRSSLDRWTGKIAKYIGTRPSALHSTFHVWRKSRRILSFLMLSTSKNEEVSQNCFVFDVVKLKYSGSLAELLRFWCCQVQILRTSRTIAWFSSLQIDR